MTSLSLPVTIMAGVIFYVGAYHLFIYFRRLEQRTDLTFALMCFAMFGYDVFSAGLYNAATVAEAIPWQRAQLAAISVVALGLVWFVSDYTGRRSRIWHYGFSGYFVLTALVFAFDRSSLTWLVDRPDIKEVALPWGLHVVYLEVASGPFTNFHAVFVLGIFLHLMWVVVDFYRRGNRGRAKPLLAAMLIFFLSITNDAAVNGGLYHFFYTMEYAYMGIVLLMANALSLELVDAAATRQELARYRDHLEELVAERTRELEKAQADLVEASRQAGMAEVATSVLHNVGNVLTSVNVAAEAIRSTASRANVDGLGRAVDLVERHARDQGGYFAADEKGRRLPVYLRELASHLAAERTAMIERSDELTRRVEHLKQIVALQQEYARPSGIVRRCEAREAMEDALAINGASLETRGVTVVREYEALPPVLLDLHKTVQILVNLVNNAAGALAEREGERRLAVRVGRLRNERIRFEVEDNGSGIPAENLTRIFAYGFTTRSDGHGFGLHASALAASELGGTLTVKSEGLGQGALFVLEVPLRSADARTA